ncbi:MAG TPA: helix-turn-helix transcriptional regulator [Clostridiales bacterium]|nr:helix-turn-helix transcriptional regulator [Clostridiales bacterium]
MYKIKQMREELGLTQEDLANRARVNRCYISELENGRRNPTLKTLKKLAKALNCKVGDLV